MITPKDLERDRRTQVALRPQWHQYPIAGIMNAHRRPRCGTEYQIVWPMNVADLRERMMAAPVAAEMNTRRSPVFVASSSAYSSKQSHGSRSGHNRKHWPNASTVRRGHALVKIDHLAPG